MLVHVHVYFFNFMQQFKGHVTVRARIHVQLARAVAV